MSHWILYHCLPILITGDSVQDKLLQNMASWHIEHFKLKEWETTSAGRILWPSPEAGYKTLKFEVPSLHPEERSVLISGDRGTPRAIGTNRPCCSPCSLPLARTLFQPITFFHSSSSNLTQKHSDLTTYLVPHFLMKAPRSHKTYIK